MGGCNQIEERRKPNPRNSEGSFTSSQISIRDNTYDDYRNVNNGNFKNNNKKIDIYKNLLKIHNDYRIKYNAQNLELNYELCQLAQEYADKYADLQNTDLSPALYKNECIGENISEFDGDISTTSKICEEWANEGIFLDSREYKDQTKHFTQMIWKDTQSVGFGFSSTPNGKNYFVSFYFPAGNIFDKFNKNIL